MRNEVIALKDEADAVVAVGVPIAIAKVLGRNTIDEQIAQVKVVEAADNVEHRGFTRTRGTQNGHELVIAKRQAHAIQGNLRKRLGDILLADVLELQHGWAFLPVRGQAQRLIPTVFIQCGFNGIPILSAAPTREWPALWNNSKGQASCSRYEEGTHLVDRA